MSSRLDTYKFCVVQSTEAENSHCRKDVMDLKQKLDAECARREKLEKELQSLSLEHQEVLY